jgi:hypothetical protein
MFYYLRASEIWPNKRGSSIRGGIAMENMAFAL